MEQELKPKAVPGKRRIKNYLLSPELQMRYGLYFLLFGFISAFFLQWFVYDKVKSQLVAFYALPDSDKLILEWIDPSVVLVDSQAIIFFIAFPIVCFVFAIFITHRIVGPVVALKRQIEKLQQGKFSSRVKLRKNDELFELAEALNELTANLQQKEMREIAERDGKVTDIKKAG
jgi:methyl-accepting chemotaxis protein